MRLQAGKHAQILNAVVAKQKENLELDRSITDMKLKEVLGHSKTQVLCGALLGVLVGLWVSWA